MILKHHVPRDRLNPYRKTNTTRHKLNKTTCFKSHMTIDDLINGDVFLGKGGSGGADSTVECPTQIYILRDSDTPSSASGPSGALCPSCPSGHFDKHHKKVKRKGILFIVVMASVVFTIVFLIVIWHKWEISVKITVIQGVLRGRGPKLGKLLVHCHAASSEFLSAQALLNFNSTQPKSQADGTPCIVNLNFTQVPHI